MASASRDGTPGKRRDNDRRDKSSRDKSSRDKDKLNPRGKASGRGESAGRKGGPAGKRGGPAGERRGAGQHQQSTRKPHRKGSSRVDAETGKIRLNNSKPARNQLVEFDGDGATYVADGMRLQKVLAAAGVGSRRGAEELIAAGRVEVDGEVVLEQGLRIDPNTAIIKVDGARVVIDETKQYLALNKPKGWHSTMSDDQGRPCIGDLVAERVMAGQRLFHVGRLDADTEGLILLTNDGELAHRLMHPSYEVPKTYLATVRGEVGRGLGRKLRQGVELEDGPVSVDSFALLEVHQGESLVRLTLHEGRKRVVRRLLSEVGFPVIRLVRTDIGPVSLGKQRPGSLRALDKKEIGALYKGVGM
ncbi:pseudouridine synthase [Gordonia sp. (in: high G+C Gram-positive bacteria)]|uniref:pseudouridine synthase n=1 Tax=Gordonia sp. (in: high G+C Gram-positive bacteria) TaxID=84139 RepID=UPI0016A79F99|nr:pseudouridine synthase [Gordonia sp. (in: high G+C Gram-positive bacteria)]NLG48082.1 rRNA pseudouridine synthase [Gordonia sp. (in: high G+C Gram-positive bacteria)]